MDTSTFTLFLWLLFPKIDQMRKPKFHDALRTSPWELAGEQCCPPEGGACPPPGPVTAEGTGVSPASEAADLVLEAEAWRPLCL